jgi:uncharacterized protein (DUF779 family)
MCGKPTTICWSRGETPAGVREMVADSWLRSVAAGVDVDASRPPITLERDVLTEYRAEHPLAKVFGRGSGFSVEAPEGVRFLIRSRLLTEAELDHFQLS